MAAARHLAFSGDKRKRPYWRDQRLLGKHLIDQQHEDILVIGKDIWTRQQMVDDLHCGNFAAAKNLSRIAHKLQVDSLEQLMNRFSMEDLFGERGFGVVTMFVFMSAQEHRGKDPLKYLDRPKDKIVTLDTEKHRILKRQHEDEKTRKREAKAARKAHPATVAS